MSTGVGTYTEYINLEDMYVCQHLSTSAVKQFSLKGYIYVLHT